jgi:hypothetical protein
VKNGNQFGKEMGIWRNHSSMVSVLCFLAGVLGVTAEESEANTGPLSRAILAFLLDAE